MQGEYQRKEMFKHRYIGMDEDEIRKEIDRLQGEVFELEQLLALYSKDTNTFKETFLDVQMRNEKLLRGLETKVQNLQDALDYTKPMKAQMEQLIKEFEVSLETLYNQEGVKKQLKDMRIFSVITVINTILLLCVVGLLGYSIIF